MINSPSWESTGVINNIPPASRNGDSTRSWDGDERRMGGRDRSVSKQMLAKTTFEQKQKMMDALDNAKAAELALRELLGSIRSAKLRRIDASTIFDYDPFTFDFPALTLHCLPAPPTLHTSTPIPTNASWSITPPNEQQFEALRAHFATQFHRWRVSCAVATDNTPEDLSYPPTNFFVEPEDLAENLQRAEAEAATLETKLAEHLRLMFTHWSKLPPAKRSELWSLELARSIGRKSDEIQKQKTTLELKEQENVHLKLQVDELSRLQQPREFRIVPPGTYPFDRKTITDLSETGMKWNGVGFRLDDRHMSLDTTIKQAIGRWKDVVRKARGGGMSAQRILSGDLPQCSPRQPQPQPQPQPSETITAVNGGGSAESLGSDADADADADMEDDGSFAEMNTDQTTLHAPEAHVSKIQDTNYRLTNGHTNNNSLNLHIDGMKGTEKQSCVSGYLRVG